MYPIYSRMSTLRFSSMMDFLVVFPEGLCESDLQANIGSNISVQSLLGIECQTKK